jgi:TonB family protein
LTNFIILAVYILMQMTKRVAFISIVCFFIYCNRAFAQQQGITTYLKKSGALASDPDSADFVRIISNVADSSGLFAINEYYPNKQLKFSGKTSAKEAIKLQKSGIYYYPNGVKREVANYKDGKLDGDNYLYYPNGELYTHRKYVPGENNSGSVFGSRSDIIENRDSTGKVLTENGNGYYVGYDTDFSYISEEGPIKDGNRDGVWKGHGGGKNSNVTETYNMGTLTEGKMVDANNQTYEYTKREVMPEFFGGLGEFGRFLGDNIKYPRRAFNNRISGTVVLGFVVERDGSLANIVVRSSPDPELSAEALRVLTQSPRWVPGKQYGRPVRVNYAVPVRFAL